MQHKTRKLLSLMLALALVLGLAPCMSLQALADDANGTFAELQAEINLNSGEAITLTKNYLCEDGFDSAGIIIDRGKTITIDLAGFKIDGQGKVRVFNVSGNLTIIDSSTSQTGMITGGNYSGDGGAIYVTETGSLTLRSGSITGNTAEGHGGGVYFAGGSGAFKVSGTAVVQGNTASEGVDNVYLPENTAITVDGPLQDGARIGVRTASGNDAVITNGFKAQNPNRPAKLFFTSDNTAFYIGENPAGEAKLAQKAIQLGAGGIKQHDTVYMGTYKADDETIIPVPWIALNTDGFMLSKYTIGTSIFRLWSDWGYYGGSVLKDRMDELYNGQGKTLFQSLEQGAIKKTTLGGASMYTGQSDDSARLFPLSFGEAETIGWGSDLLKARSINAPEGSAGWWWLRSSSDDASAYCVLEDGDRNIRIIDGALGVRPAFNLNVESVLLTSAAEGGKEAGASGLAPVEPYAGSEWKLTLKDTANRRDFQAVVTAVDGEKLTVTWDWAQTGENEFLSAVIKDNATGALTHYGRLAELKDESDKYGTWEIDLSGIEMTGKTLCVFNEQYNGEKKTDYASKLVELPTDAPNAYPVELSVRGFTVLSYWNYVRPNSEVTRVYLKPNPGYYYSQEYHTLQVEIGDKVYGDEALYRRIGYPNECVVEVKDPANTNGGFTGKVKITYTTEPIPYEIKYELDGGTNNENNPGTYTVEDTITLAAPEWTGYTFDGWYETADFSGNPVTEIPKNSTGEQTFYAKWTADIYNIDYQNLNGASNSNPKTYTIVDTPLKLAALTGGPTGYAFDGWYENAAFDGDAVTEIPKNSAENKTFYAKWTPMTYTITFDPNGGSGNMSDVTVTEGEKLTLPECGFTAPEDKEFDKWDKGAPGAQIDVTADMTVKAQWKDKPVTPPTTYTVTFDSNGGTGDMSPVTVTEGEKLTLPECGFTAPDGKEFDKWDKGAPGAQIDVTADMTVKAEWKDKAVTPPTPATLESITVTAQPTKTSYTEGETFDKTGMVITAKYDDGTEKPVATFTVTPSGALKPTDTSVTVSYTEGGVTKTVTVPVTVTAKPVDPPIGGGGTGGGSSSPGIRPGTGTDTPVTPPTPVTPTTPTETYDDVKADDWFYEAIEYVTDQGVMNGTGDKKFDPYVSFTRAMVVTVLYRLEGEPKVSGRSSFNDVAEDQWYTEAIAWGEENEIVNGYDPKTFGPLDIVTREQLATILYRYAKFKGYDVSVGQDTNILSYDDALEIGDWAMEAMQWACGAGLINGRTETTLVPKGQATRAEAATILMRFIKNVK